MAITQSQYTAPDKVQGDIFYSDEHNEMKSVLNQKTDADNAILIEGDQSILGELSVEKIIGTNGADFNGQASITSSLDHIKLVSPRTDGNTSLDRTTLVMTKADSSFDFYVYSDTDGEGRFSVSTTGSGWFSNQLATEGRLTINHRSISDDSKAIIINSGAAATTTPTDVIWSRSSKEGARLRFNDKFDMYLSVMNNSNILTSRIGIGSQRGTGLSRGVTLYDGDDAIRSMYTLPNGIHVPTEALATTGIQILSKTLAGQTGNTLTAGSGSIFFKEHPNNKYGMALEYNGVTTNRLYINRYENSTTAEAVLSFSRTNNTVTNYGDMAITTKTVSTGVPVTRTWLKSYEWKHGGGSEGKLLIQMDGAMIIGAGDVAGAAVAANVGTVETLYMSSDHGINFYTNLQHGWGSKKSMLFSDAGDLTIDGISYATNFQFSSDITLKENIVPLTTSLDINFIEFNFKGSSIKRYGVSAQEVQSKLPELVTEDGNGNLTVSMVDLLVIKVVELEKKIKELTK